MDKSLQAVAEKRIERTVQALRRRGFEAQYIADRGELLAKVGEYVREGVSCSVGGSVTLFETGVIDFIKASGCTYLDRYAPGADVPAIMREALSCDVYLMSTNAVTEQGELYNVDGNGNRVAALSFGPKKVLVIAGANKIVRDLDQARLRMKAVAAPANSVRLEIPNPCMETGMCMECSSPTKICNIEVVTRYQRAKDGRRITVLILPESFGY